MSKKTPIFARKVFVNGNALLLPSTQDSIDWLARVNPDVPVRLDPKQPRNGKHHRLYWKVLGKVAHNSDYKTSYKLHEAIMMQLDMCEERVIVMPNGNCQVTWDRDSTSYEKMDQAAFSEYFDRVKDIIYENMGIDVDDVIAELKRD